MLVSNIYSPFIFCIYQEKSTVWKHRCWYSPGRRRCTDNWGERWQFMWFVVIAVLLFTRSQDYPDPTRGVDFRNKNV